MANRTSDLGNAVVTNVDMKKIKSLFGELGTTNYYQLQISAFKTTSISEDESNLSKYLQSKNVDKNFYTRDLNLLCTEAVIPASAFATSEVKDNFMGLTQEFAHSRIYTDIDLTFYVDRNYQVNRLFECWMDYCSGGGSVLMDQFSPGYFRRFNYPSDYKVDSVKIIKFERDSGKGSSMLRYKLKNAFPKSISSIPVSYGQTELLKTTISFNYDYYSVEYVDAPNKTESNSKPAVKSPTTDPRDVPNILGNTPRELEQIRATAAINTLYRSNTPGLLDRVLSGRARSQAGRDVGQRIFDSF